VRPLKHPRALKQMTLFRPQSAVPPWTGFPAEVREQVLNLLARLLRRHRHVQLAEREARDE
jgi:hypothetical protein